MYMQGYKQKKISTADIIVKDSIAAAYDDAQVYEVCRGLFDNRSGSGLQKKGAYKTILRADVFGMPCIVKHYTNRGAVRLAKSLFARSKARHEFDAGRYIHQSGIATAEPLLLAEVRRWGAVREGLVIMPFIAGARELRDVLFDRRGMRPGQRRALVASFGRLTGKIFQSGIFQYDYSLNNFLVTRQGDGHRLWFIDFERVVVGKDLSADRKLELLGKLNRAGNEVRLAERLRFLQGFLETDTSVAVTVKACAAKVQQRTVLVLKRDVKRLRLTSLYTHARYDRISLPGYTGLSKKGFSVNQAIQRTAGFSAGQAVLLDDGETLQTVMLPPEKARRAWAALTLLIVAGLPLPLPEALVEDGRRGIIFFKPGSYTGLESFSDARSPLGCFIGKHFSQELQYLITIFSDSHM